MKAEKMNEEIGKSAEGLVAIPSVKIALHLLGCAEGNEKTALQQALTAVCKDNKWGLNAAFKWIAASKSVPDAVKEQALAYINCISQPAILRLAENGIASMLFPPLSFPVKDMLFQRKVFTLGLFTGFRNCVEDLVAHDARRKTPLRLGDVLKTLIQLCEPKLTPESLADEERLVNKWGENSRDFFHSILGHSVREQALNQPWFSPFDNIRMVAVPPPSAEEKTLHFIICQRTDSGFIQLDKEQFGELLRDTLLRFMYNTHALLGSQEEVAVWIEYVKNYLNTDSLVTSVSEAIQNCGEAFHTPTLLFVRENTVRSTIRSTDFSFGIGAEGRIATDEVYFCRSDATRQKFPLSNEQEIARFLDRLKEIRGQIGQRENLSLPAGISNHAFRVLPNHPSIISFSNMTLPGLEKRMKNCFEQKISNYTNWKPYLERIMKDVLAGKVPDDLASTIDGWKNMTCKQTFNAMEAYLTNALGKLSDKQVGMINTGVMDVLISKEETLLHFADANWFKQPKDQVRRCHFAFSYNPRVNAWGVYTVPDVADPTIKVRKEDMPDIELTFPKVFTPHCP